MNHVKKVDIPARGELVLKPGSFHIMIAGINQPLLLDDEIPAILIFENDFEIKIVFKVTETAKSISSKDKKKHSH
jgi:copper(I)-binding protein